MTASILLFDDGPATPGPSDRALVQAGYRTLRASSVSEAHEMMHSRRPDLLVLGWALPGAQGLPFARELLRDGRTRGMPIVFTGDPSEFQTIAALKGGAEDYLPTPLSPREMLARIRAILRVRAPHLSGEAVQIAGVRLDAAGRAVAAGSTLDLTELEYRVLRFMMTHPNRVFSRERLLDEIWGQDSLLNPRIVDAYMRRLRAALQPSANEGLLETVRCIGYRCRGLAHAA